MLGGAFERAVEEWRSLVTDDGARFDAVIDLRAEEIQPQVTWGTSPEMVLSIEDRVPDPEREKDATKRDALKVAIDDALAGKTVTLWLTDKKGRDVAIPTAKIAFVEIGSGDNGPRIGFGG